MAVGPRDDLEDAGRVTAHNNDSKYTRQTFAPTKKGSGGEWTLDIDKTQLRWESYVKAGYYVRLILFFFFLCFGPHVELQGEHRAFWRSSIRGTKRGLVRLTCWLRARYLLALAFRRARRWSLRLRSASLL